MACLFQNMNMDVLLERGEIVQLELPESVAASCSGQERPPRQEQLHRGQRRLF